MNNTGTVSLSTTIAQNISGYSPFSLIIDPSVLTTDNVLYKLSYDFGDGTYLDQLLTLETLENNPKSFLQTHLYSLSTVGQETYNIKVNAYQFGEISTEYDISLLVLNPPIETTTTVSSGISGFFDEVHLVGSRMFGPNNDILYMFESVAPNYILPVMINWKQKPALPPVIPSIPDIRPFRVLAPFENEEVTSIDTIGHVIAQNPPTDPNLLPDSGSVDSKLYSSDTIASRFLGSIDNNWNNINNWTNNSGLPVISLPTEDVDVDVEASISIATSPLNARNITFQTNTSLANNIVLNVAQSAIFVDNSYNFGIIEGNAYFKDNTFNEGFYPTLLSLSAVGGNGSQVFGDASSYNRTISVTGTPRVTSYPATSSQMVTNGLVFYMDAKNGSTFTDSVCALTANQINYNSITQYAPSYVSSSPSYFNFNGSSQCVNFNRDPSYSLLLHFDGLNGSTLFINSANATTPTVNYGSPVISTAQSVFGGSSLYLDGSSDLVVADNASLNLSNTPFTIECRFYATSLPTTVDNGRFPTVDSGPVATIISKDQWGYNFSWCIALAQDGFMCVTGDYGAGATRFYTASSISTNEWHHVAYVYNGTTLSVYLDGVIVGSPQATIISNGDSNISIGCMSYNNPSNRFTGYIDELRISKGYALYNSNFTPAVVPFTTISQDLGIPLTSNSDVNAIVNNFSLETWINVQQNREWGGIFSLADVVRGEQWSLNTTAGGSFRFGSGGRPAIDGASYTLNTWNHLVVTFNNGTVKFYLNGILTSTNTFSISPLWNIDDIYLSFGDNQYGGQEYLNAYISMARIYNRVLTQQDVSQNFMSTASDFGIQYPQGAFLDFSTGNSYVTPSSGVDFAFNKFDFTIEANIYPTQTNGVFVLYDNRPYYDNIFPVFYLRYNKLEYNNGNYDLVYGTDNVPINQWSHIAVTRHLGITRMFLNGKQTGVSVNDNINYQSDDNLPKIGSSFDGYPFYGYIANLDVTKGIAKYTGSYVVPPLSSFLMRDSLLTGTVSNTAFFLDSSKNYGTLTNAVFSGIDAQNFGYVQNASVFFPSPSALGGTYGTVNYYNY